LIFSGPNVGHARNFERAICQCSGELIFLADQDDVWDNEKVKLMVNVYDLNSNALAVFSDGSIVDNNLQWAGSRISSMMHYPIGNASDGQVMKSDWPCYRSSVVGATLSFRRSIIPLVLPLPDGIFHHDSWISKNCSLRGNLYYINSMLIKYRQHSSNVVGVTSNPLKKIFHINLTKQKHLKELKLLMLELELLSNFESHKIDFINYSVSEMKNWLNFTKCRIRFIEGSFQNVLDFSFSGFMKSYAKHSNGFRSLVVDLISLFAR
jgi:glycosyltransferase involved in cell wall biosynthesis